MSTIKKQRRVRYSSFNALTPCSQVEQRVNRDFVFADLQVKISKIFSGYAGRDKSQQLAAGNNAPFSNADFAQATVIAFNAVIMAYGNRRTRG